MKKLPIVISAALAAVLGIIFYICFAGIANKTREAEKIRAELSEKYNVKEINDHVLELFDQCGVGPRYAVTTFEFKDSYSGDYCVVETHVTNSGTFDVPESNMRELLSKLNSYRDSIDRGSDIFYYCGVSDSRGGFYLDLTDRVIYYKAGDYDNARFYSDGTRVNHPTTASTTQTEYTTYRHHTAYSTDTEYNMDDYSDYEDFYYDNQEDFDGLDDAEDYFDEYGSDY